jgi:uncharacterized protein (TIGR02678 family)
MAPTASWRRSLVADTALAEHLGAERSTAIRTLLAQPLLDSGDNPDGFRLVARHAGWLTEYFEKACGWALTVDATGGYARLAKRAAVIDSSRPLRRTRGGGAAPFDRRRYQLLCLVCAELVRHPVTTIGLLAGAVTADSTLDTSRRGERVALVDALRVLMAWGTVRATAGDIDAFADSAGGNAILTADTARLHRLLVSAAAPSALPDELDTEQAAARLEAEPRYGDVADLPGEAGDEARNRWARHHLARRLLDDPVLHLDELSGIEADYVASPSGRKWLRDRAAEAGFDLEERAEGLLAVDPDGVATDRLFPAPLGNAHQLALLLADRLVTTSAGGRRQLGSLSPRELQDLVDAIFAKFPTWARGQRDEGGPERLGREAVSLLSSFGLVRRHPDGGLMARPALARYRVGDPVLSDAEPSLFEEES